MGSRVLWMSAAAAVLAGCASPVPVADNFRLSFQKVARTAHHWDVVADDVVAQTSDTLQAKGVLADRPVYVVQPVKATAFDSAFRDFMLNRMVDRGMPVNVCSAPSELQVRYSTRVIEHSANMPLYRPGFLTALASGVWAGHGLDNAGLSFDGAMAIALPLAVAGDVAAGHIAEPTKTEIIVTTTITEGNRFVMRRSDVYYVPDGDRSIFTAVVAREREPECGPQGGPRPVRASFDFDDGSAPLWRSTAERVAAVRGCTATDAQLVSRAPGREGYAVQCLGGAPDVRVTCAAGKCESVASE